MKLYYQCLVMNFVSNFHTNTFSTKDSFYYFFFMKDSFQYFFFMKDFYEYCLNYGMLETNHIPSKNSTTVP